MVNSTAALRPTLFKLTACFVYDALVVIALSFLLGWLFIVTLGDATLGIKRYALQLFLWLSIGLYFVWCWSRSGQTLAMHTWRLKLVQATSKPLNLQTAAIRYVLATISLGLFGFGFFWALFDRDRYYLHDRLLKTSIISLPKQ
jgi:uncharacterized RDD family membrane protein YckC